jgi:hypothetical protein
MEYFAELWMFAAAYAAVTCFVMFLLEDYNHA